MRVSLRDVRPGTWSELGALTGPTVPRGDHLRARGCAQPPLRRPDIWQSAGSVPPVYRRSSGTAIFSVGDFVAEIEAVGVPCHIRASNPIPGLVPRSWGSPSYEMGKVEHRGLRGSWGSGSYEVGKVEHGHPRVADGSGRNRESGLTGTSKGKWRWMGRCRVSTNQALDSEIARVPGIA